MVPVLGKIEALFAYVMDPVKNAPTGRVIPDQLHADLQHEATTCSGGDSTLSTALCLDNNDNIRVTGKIDGTCCRVYKGRLWARQDIRCGRQSGAQLPPSDKWPMGWMPTNGTTPDAGGHVIGFRPAKLPGDPWHLDALVVVSAAAAALTSERSADKSAAEHIRRWKYDASLDALVETIVPLAELEGQTVELIGPKVQGNPHGVPKHGIVVHGSIVIPDLDWTQFDKIRQFMTDTALGRRLEGIVLHHCGTQKLYKLHRGHMELPHKLEHFPVIEVQIMTRQDLVQGYLDKENYDRSCQSRLYVCK